MRGRLPIFYSALMLTATNLFLRLVGTSFQVYLSAKVGAAGIGLLQLVLSVGSLSVVAGIAGVRTAAMYLTAEELGKKRSANVSWVLSGCFLYSCICSCTIALALYHAAPYIGANWIGNVQTVGAIQLFSAFLPATCLCAVMTGYFTAANRIGTLAAVEVCEQLVSMFFTILMLSFWGQNDPVRACQCIILGSSTGGCVTLLLLILLRILERSPATPRIPIFLRLCHTAVPLGIGDIAKAGINTVENLLVPKQLALNTEIANPLAAFGTVSGMVFPVLMFPACILFGLAELLIPELARCNASGNTGRTAYLVRKSLRMSLLYGALLCGLMFLSAEALCIRIYGNNQAGAELKRYALLIPMLYCDAITDAMTKGLGQQKACVRYNILTSLLDVLLLYEVLPKYGMSGYFFSFFVTHFLNFLLSLRRLKIITGQSLRFSETAFTASAVISGIWICSHVSAPTASAAAYLAVLTCILYLTKVVHYTDIIWLRRLIFTNRKRPA